MIVSGSALPLSGVLSAPSPLAASGGLGLGRRRADQELGDQAVEQAGLDVTMSRDDSGGRLVDEVDPVAFGFFGELLLDLAQLGKPKHPADPDRIDAVFGREDDCHEDRGGGGYGDDRGPQQDRKSTRLNSSH